MPLERVGLILQDKSVVELKNQSLTPEVAFQVSADDLIKYEGSVYGSWHTHPDSDSCLSSEDYLGFQQNPTWVHYILGKEGVSAYSVTETGVVLKCAVDESICTGIYAVLVKS